MRPGTAWFAFGWLLAAALCLEACSSSSPTEPPPAQSSPPVTVKGTEQVGWDQAADSSELASLKYLAYVDGVPHTLVDVTCAPSQPIFTCSAPLPPMSAGSHRLELATVGNGQESARSSPVNLVVVP
jgi:hypothetical protein